MDCALSYFSVVSAITVIVVCLQVVLWKRRYRVDYQGRDGRKPLPPGSMGWPFVGETLHFMYLGVALFVGKFAKDGNIYKTHLFGSPTIRVSGAAIIRELISRQPNDLDVKWPASTRILMGPNSLPTVVGERHKSLKSIIQKVLQPARLSYYLPCVQKHVRKHLLSWTQRGRMLGFTECEVLMTSIFTEILLGIQQEDASSLEMKDALATINANVFTVPIQFPGSGFKKAMAAKQFVSDFVKAQLSEVPEDKENVCILDVLRAHFETPDTPPNDQQVLDNAMALIIAGSSTTTSAMSHCLLLLGKHPDVVKEMRQELDQLGLLGQDSDASLTYDILQKLSFVPCIEKEVLRLHPPVGGMYRQTHVDLETEDFIIPKDWSVIYSIRDTHQTTEVFQKRDLFLPERWRDPVLEKKLLRSEEGCSYMPFGAGSRLCPGRQLARMILHVFLVELARLVDWEVHNEDPTTVYIPVTMPEDRLPVTFRIREQGHT